MENIKNHNNLVESRMIANELSKFKLDIRKLSSNSSASQKFHDSLDSDTDSEEVKLLQALRDTEDATFAYKNEDKIVVERQVMSKIERCEFSYDLDSTLSGSTATLSDEKIDIKVSAQPKEFQEYYEIQEDATKFNEDDEEESCTGKEYDPMFFTCCANGQCEFIKNLDSQSFYSLPNLSDGDVEDLMKITKFQSLMSVELQLADCPCCNDPQPSTDDEKIQKLNKSIEEAETERLLIVRRMEIEEKNYQELVIMSSGNAKNINESQFECEKIIGDLFAESEEIEQLKRADRELMRRYFKDWLQKTTVNKILKTNAFSNEDRVKKINEFLNKIRLEQNKGVSKKSKQDQSKPQKKQTSSKSGNKTLRKDYEHKLKVQQDIIELQKLKIQRQERLLTEMKLAKFSEMVKESKNELKMELMNTKHGNSRLRAKARCIKMIANIPPDPAEEERRKLLAQGLVVPKFLQKMQERAEERLARHEEARERRMRLEQEKEDAKTAAEIAKRQEDEEAKRRRLYEMREKRRQEKMAKLLKEQERQRFQENLKMARDHYTKKLMQKLGFKAFELLIKLKRSNYKKSILHRRKVCMRKCFKRWHANAKIVWDRKREQADKVYHLSLMRMCYKSWLHVHSIHKKKYLVAIDWYEVKITEKLFNCWLQFTEEYKMVEMGKMRNAEAHYNCQIKWKLFDCWQRFPALMKIERETEVRRQKWRMKIWDLLPDYQPNSQQNAEN